MTVFKVGNVWRYRFQIKGKRYFETFPGKTKSKVKALEDAHKTRVREGRDDVEDCETNFKRFVEEVYLPFVKATKSENTYHAYCCHCEVLIGAFGHLDLREITTGRFEEFRRGQQERVTIRGSVQSSASINKLGDTLSAIFTRAITLKLVDPAVRPKIDHLKVANHRIRYLTIEEEARLRAAAAPWPYLVDMVVVFLATGLRRNELFGLKKDNLDFTLNLISVVGKGNKLRRIPMDPASEAYAILKRMVKESPTPFLFTSPHRKAGGKFRKIDASLLKACQDAGIDPPITLHVLRHTFCTRLAAAGVDIRTIQELAGHSDITMTMRYTHLVETRAHSAIRQLSRFQEVDTDKENNVLRFPVRQGQSGG